MARRQLGALILAVVAVAAACGDDDDAGGSPNTPGADAGPIVKKAFPLATPSIGGYALVDAFPGVVFDIPSAIVWPKQKGAMPISMRGQTPKPTKPRKQSPPPSTSIFAIALI